jgi:hypothetical protein
MTGGTVSGPPPRSSRSGASTCPQERSAQEQLPRARTTAGWSWPPRVEAGPLRGLSAWANQGARTSHPTGEEVRCRHVPLRKWSLNQHHHVSGGFQSSARSQPNYRIKCGWLGCACQRQGMGYVLTRWAGMGDITVSPPVTEAACHVTAPHAWARDVWSHHSAARMGEGLL